MKFIKNYILFIFLWGAICSPFTVYGQKKPKKSKAQVNSLSQADSLQADALFIDANADFLRGDYDKAILHLQKVKKSFPEESAIYHLIAKCYFAQDNLVEAIKYEGIAIDLSPTNKYYYLELGDYLREIKAWNQMVECYTKMLTNTQGAEEYYYDLANLHVYLYRSVKYQYPQGDIPKKNQKTLDVHFTQAIYAYEQYEIFYGVDSDMILDKQDFLVLAGKNDLAIREGEKLISLYPNNSSYPIKNAKIIKQHDGIKKALDYLLEIDKERGFNESMSVTIVSYFVQLNEFQNLNDYLIQKLKNENLTLLDKTTLLQIVAQRTQNELVLNSVVEESNQLLEKYPNNKKLAYLTADIQYFQKDFEKARANYLLALSKVPDNLEAWQKVIDIDLELNNDTYLKSDLTKALNNYPKNANFNAQLGLMNYSQKDYNSALINFKKATIYTSRPELQVKYLSLMADCYNSLKEFTKSDSIYEEALIISPNSDLILNNYAYNLAQRKESLNKAKSMAKRLTLLYPNNPNYLDTYGWVLYQQKKYKEASIYLEKASSQTQSPVIFEHYADTLFQLGKLNEAKEWWQKAIDNNAENPEQIKEKITNEKL